MSAQGRPVAGTLLLVPAPLDLGTEETALQDVLPHGVIQRAAGLGHWVAEDARSARALLRRVHAVAPLALPLQAIHIAELPRPRKGSREAVPAEAWHALLQPALEGHDLGLISEAGLPAVADPGAALVAEAHQAGVPVLPLPGASSLLLTLAASGLNGQSFAFVGYLPQDASERAQRVRALEALALKTGQTQLFIETPYRNAALWQALLQTLQPSTQLACAAGLTLAQASIHTRSASQWRGQAIPVDNRTPAVFAIGG